MLCVGVDGWSGGWVAVALRYGKFLEAQIHRTVAEILTYWQDAETIGIDAPVGLTANGQRRRADLAARAALGSRGASIFMAPPHPVAESLSYEAANQKSRDLFGRGLSRQDYYLGRRSLEIEGADTEGKIVEVHPELSFWALNQHRPLEHAKTTWGGQAERRHLLASGGILIREDLGPVAAVPPADIFDAAACAYTALRIARGAAAHLPADAAPDEPRIWY
jgi:predicted RNase H-like nuclease